MFSLKAGSVCVCVCTRVCELACLFMGMTHRPWDVFVFSCTCAHVLLFLSY